MLMKYSNFKINKTIISNLRKKYYGFTKGLFFLVKLQIAKNYILNN